MSRADTVANNALGMNPNRRRTSTVNMAPSGSLGGG
jgi:hypothetical protein